MQEGRQLRFAGALAIWAAIALAVAFLGTWYGYGGRSFAVALAVFTLFLAGQIFPAAGGVSETLAAMLGPADLLLLPLALIVLYVAYAVGTGNLTWTRVAIAAAYIVLPAAFVLVARARQPGTWADYAAVLLVWMPVALRFTYRLWPYPSQLTHTLTILLALNTAAVAFLFLRKLDGVGYTLAWGRGFAFAVGFHFLLFAAIAVPLGEAIGFLHFGTTAARLKSLPVAAMGILVFTAWPEEFLFRGLLQNLLTRTLRRPSAGWIVASVVFGLAHIQHGVFPNWRYALLATIAGLFYGRTWMKTGSLTASCLVHALVDITWHALFT
jgi:membrane protease YdiL (CAAX protease family)